MRLHLAEGVCSHERHSLLLAEAHAIPEHLYHVISREVLIGKTIGDSEGALTAVHVLSAVFEADVKAPRIRSRNRRLDSSITTDRPKVGTRELRFVTGVNGLKQFLDVIQPLVGFLQVASAAVHPSFIRFGGIPGACIVEGELNRARRHIGPRLVGLIPRLCPFRQVKGRLGATAARGSVVPVRGDQTAEVFLDVANRRLFECGESVGTELYGG